MDFLALIQECAPTVHPQTMAAVMRVESTFNPYAIGVVGGRLVRQPTNKTEAVATAKSLELAGYNFSLGIGQVNRYNLPKYGLNYDRAFNPCDNIRAGSQILKDCYDRAKLSFNNDQQALKASFSCYYSGNFLTGFKPDFKGQTSYVQKVLNNAVALNTEAGEAIPVIRTTQTKPIPAESSSQKENNNTPYFVSIEPNTDTTNIYNSATTNVFTNTTTNPTPNNSAMIFR